MTSKLYNNVTSLSRSSLLFDESDDLHSVAGNVLNLDHPIYPYYTRSVARLSARSSNSGASLSNSSITRHSVTLNLSHCSRNSIRTKERKNSKRLTSSDSFTTASNQTNIDQNLRISSNCSVGLADCNRARVNGVLRNLSGTGSRNLSTLQVVPFAHQSNADNVIAMDFPNNNCPSKTWRFFSILAFIGLIAMIAVHIHNNLANSKSFLSKVEDDLCRIKEEIERMKNSVVKGTKTQLESMEKDTRQKLDTVERLLRDIRKEKKATPSTSFPSCAKSDGDEGGIRAIVAQLLEEYSADKTGKTDFALESAGGSIVSCSRDTQPYNPASGLTTLFGIPICYKSNGPRSIIQPTVLPGECWAFKGTSGAVTIKLLGPVFINGVSLEHISKAISPSGEIDSAPKEFSIGKEKMRLPPYS
ncbi:hypothetical protein ILUMI_12943 [Ignelater luminosus]|uniref:SUN domain-containing protein n=1 Tax=Ignelater luminosus TaxID=2038154 RepID=A0A8K0CVF6_IGNLU|nr:hypothetical protein ILUMI_12943 [Ignelater luminosus]